MSLFQSLFRSSKPKSTQQTRRTWRRRHRSKAAAASPDREDKPVLSTEDANPDQPDPKGETGTARSSGEEKTPDAHEAPSAPAPEPTPEASTRQKQQPSVESVRSSQDSKEKEVQHGSKRLKKLVARLRGDRSHDEGSSLSLVEAMQQTVPEESKSISTQVNADPVENDVPTTVDHSVNDPVNSSDAETKNDTIKDTKENVPSRAPSAMALKDNQQQRNVSAQTACSKESKVTSATVSRHPSQRVQDPLESFFGSEWLKFDQGATHQPEASDPFSDGKMAETPSITRGPSKRSKQSSMRKSSASMEPPGQSQTDTLATSRQASRVGSTSSQPSRRSTLSCLDPLKATAAFNALASRMAIPLSIPVNDHEVTGGENPALEGENTPRPRNRLLQRVRPTQSNLNLEADSQSTAPKLRRTKTFANFARRPSPMTSLRGKSVETLARLGGHSFLVLPNNLVPFPLQLPACIVATVMYLRKSPAGASELFVEPGDIKAATTMYDHFASQVLSAEKDEPRIALTMRVIAMPHLETDEPAATVLSVGWTFKALLAGLPDGILGSIRLYETLKAIYYVETPAPIRVRFITLAIVALTSEMQCALISAVFGLLTSLLEQEPPGSGNAVRRVASLTEADRLARVFGPLLLGRRDGDSAAEQNKVEQEVEEQRVAGMLLEHWRGVSQQLRDWNGGH